jgi:ketosteroid isomerase-like protein
MRRILMSAVLALAPFVTLAQSDAPDGAVLRALLAEFLAHVDDPAMHDRFWADDLVYTRSAGVRIGKAELMQGMRAAPPAKPGDPKATFSAEDVRVRQYGDTAVVAFRLVGTTRDGTETEVAEFLNTGTFVKRDGRWQAVAWQSTRIPDAAAEPGK